MSIVAEPHKLENHQDPRILIPSKQKRYFFFETRSEKKKIEEVRFAETSIICILLWTPSAEQAKSFEFLDILKVKKLHPGMGTTKGQDLIVELSWGKSKKNEDIVNKCR